MLRKNSYIFFIWYCGNCLSVDAQTSFLNGNAFSTGTNCYVLTNASSSQRGSVWFSQQLNLSNPFDIQFMMNFGITDASGGDGMTFVLQRAGTAMLGTTGGSLGYLGIAPSLAVEFDTYQNTVLSDPVADHVAVIRDGILNHSTAANIAGPVSATSSQANIEDGLDHRVRINWNPDNDSLLVFFDCELRIAVQYDIVTNIFAGNPNVWWGFTGSTGGAFNRQSVCVTPTAPVFVRDTIICKADTIRLNVPFGSNYTWSPAIGISDPNIASPLFFPSATTRYYLSYRDECNHLIQDSVLVTVSSVSLNLGADTNLCYGRSALLAADPGYLGYVWQNGTTGQTFMATASGDYWVVAINARGCYGYDSIHVNIMPQLSLNVSPNVPVICSGDSIGLAASGAATYSWSPGIGLSNQTGDSVNASPPVSTNYQLVATDVWGCVDSLIFSIAVNPLPVVNMSSDTAICAGSTAQLIASGGVFYSWTPSSSLTNSNIPNPVAHLSDTTAYTVLVTDANGCTGSKTTTVTVNPLPFVTLNQDTFICIGSTVQLAASGGINYSWYPTSGINDAHIFNPVAVPSASTVYSVTVTNEFGCALSSNVTVIVNPLPVINIIPDSSICIGSTIQLAASGGTDYSWSPSAFLNDSSVANPMASPLSNTSYRVTVTDANGCVSNAVTDIVVHPYVSVTTVPEQSICIGANALLLASGGMIYSWSPATGLTNPSIANPVASPVSTTVYVVSVTDANGCTGSGEEVVTVNPLPVVSVSADTAICVGSSVQLSSSGGENYLWYPSTGLSSANISNPLCAPALSLSYTVLVTDSLGCSSSAITKVIVNPLPVISIIPDTAICMGSSIQLTASGGTDYSWSPSASLNNSSIANPIATPLFNTSYTLIVTDDNGCVNNAALHVVVHPTVNVITNADQSICIGSNAQLHASGGMIYSWSPATGITNPAIANPIAIPVSTTVYVVNVTDANGCSGSGSITVTVNPLPSVSISADTSVCFGSIAHLSASGGINYSWYPLTGLNNPGISNPVAAPSSSTAYSVSVTDSLGCTSFANTTVIVNPLPVINCIPDASICIGSTIQLTASGGINYSWTPSTSLNFSNVANPVANPFSTTNYTVTVADVNGCVNNAVTHVVVHPYINVAIVPDQNICIGSNVELNASGGSIYSWNPTTGLNNPDISNPVASPDTTTTYSVKVSDLNNCTSTGIVTVHVNPLPVVKATNDTTIVLGSPLRLYAEGGVNYSWSPASYLDCISCDQPSASPTEEISYFVTVTDVNGCEDLDTVNIKVEDIITLFIPNAFTPGNHDTKNDILLASGKGIKEFHFIIFDRWGKTIFESDDTGNGWDGTYRGKAVQDGVYVYSAQAVSFSGKSISTTGTVSILK